ncbi:hypothetical protein BC941DRAFT_437306 [Chlamydoabsidia padenii]|nr:hypothetical protein BC941DRAFT_437306 [Chlamydoabsidia padenii]
MDSTLQANSIPVNTQDNSSVTTTGGADQSSSAKKHTRPHRHFNKNKNKNQDDKKTQEKKVNGGANQHRRSKKRPDNKGDEKVATTDTTNNDTLKKPVTTLTKADSDSDNDSDKNEDDSCFICTEPVVTFAVSACNHRTCHLCALRLRAFYGTKNCVYCNTEQKTIIFTKDPVKPFEAFTQTDIFYVDRKLDIRFEDKLIHQDTVLLLQYNCPEPNCDVACNGWGELKKHTSKEHHLVLCDLCIKNKKIFSHEHTLYTHSQLNKHYKVGDKEALNKEDDDSGFKGHPECHFCRESFYGDDELFVHCRDKHEQCHICVRNGVRHEYYADYNGLEKHFKKEHYLCMYRECLNKKFIVFDSNLDLKAHEVEVHGASGRVDLNFEYGSRVGESGRGKGKPKIQQRQQHQEQQHESSASASTTSALTSNDFPSIGGSPSSSERTTVPGQPKKNRSNEKQGQNTRLQKPKGFGSLTSNNEEQWPGLGQVSGGNSRSATASPSASTTTNSNNKEEDTKQRHAEVLQKLGRLLDGPRKVEQFRALTTAYRNNSLDGSSYVCEIINLCGNDTTKAGTILKDVEDLMDSHEKKREIMHAWRNAQANIQNFPALTSLDNRSGGTHGTSQRVLVIKGGSTRVGGTRTTSKSKAGVWDRVANAAAHGAPATSSRGHSPRGSPVSSRPSSPMSFPTPQVNRTKTAWAGTSSSSPQPPIKDDFPEMVTQQFPSLPSSGTSRRTHPTVLNMRRNNNNGSAWSPSNDYDSSEYIDTDPVVVDKKKKGKKGKQVLFRVGL